MSPIRSGKLLLLLLVIATSLFTACSRKPDCTVRETAPGVFEPYGNCNNCTSISVIGYGGTTRTMGMEDAQRYIQSYPPTAYTGHNSGLSDILLYNFLLNSNRAPYYQTVYAPQYRSYYRYDRTTRAGVSSVPKSSVYSQHERVSNRQVYSTGTRATIPTATANRPSSGFTRTTAPTTSYRASSGFSRSSTPSTNSRSYSAPSRSYSSPSSGYRSSSGFSRR